MEDGQPLFSRAHDNELWVLLLEKAYAKVFGSYYSLIGGDTSQALMDLSGCPTKAYDLESDISVQAKIKSGELFKQIKTWDHNRFLMSASTPVDKELCHKSLIAQHSYAILEAKEHSGHQLLKIRNPWGNEEWDGDWSDKSQLWTQEMKEAFN